MTTASYDSDVVVDFIRAHTDDRTLNGKPFAAADRRRVEGWLAHDTVPMSSVDSFLHRYGLMLFELEMWAQDTLGRSGFNSEDLLPYY